MNKNYIFLIVIFISIIAIGIFNYKVDAYNFFKINSKLTDFSNSGDMFYTYLKRYKDLNYDKVLIGSSDASVLFINYNPEKHRLIKATLNLIDIEEEYEILKNYLKIYPDTKHVYIIASYYSTISFCPHEKLPKFISDKITFIEYFNLLFSYKTIKQSFLKLMKKEKTSYDYNNLDFDNWKLISYPYHDYYSNFSEHKFKEAEINHFKYTKKMIDLLNEKNIKYTIIIPPYNAGMLVRTYKNKTYKKYIENYKKFLVDQAGTVYDFAFINKYTTEKIYENNYLYKDIFHISEIFSQKIFRYFLFNEYKNNDFCLILNKNNVDKIIETENKKLDLFIKNNKDFVEFYDKLTEESKKSNKRFGKESVNYIKNIPKREKEEFIDFIKKEHS